MTTRFQDRLLSAFGAVAVVALLGYLLFIGSIVTIPPGDQPPMMLLDFRARHPVEKPPVARPRRKHSPAKASPANLRGKAAAIVAPVRIPVPPVPPPLVTAPKAGSGMAPTTGASDRPGPGQGAGGEGNGSGAGGAGNGDGGENVPPRLIEGHLEFSDLPSAMREAGIGGSVSVRYRVDVSGRVSDCTITASSGNAELDARTCQLIQRRFRFDPSRDPQGQPVSSLIEETHSWEINKTGDPERQR